MKSHRAYVLMLTLILLFIVSVVMSTLHFSTQSQQLSWEHFVKQQEKMLYSYSVKHAYF